MSNRSGFQTQSIPLTTGNIASAAGVNVAFTLNKGTYIIQSYISIVSAGAPSIRIALSDTTNGLSVYSTSNADAQVIQPSGAASLLQQMSFSNIVIVSADNTAFLNRLYATTAGAVVWSATATKYSNVLQITQIAY